MTDTEGVQDRKDTAEPALEEQVQRKYTKEPSLQEHVAGICTTDDMTYTEEIQMSFPLENPDEDSETFTATEVNLTLLGTENLLYNCNTDNFTLSADNTQLNLLLNKTSQENTPEPALEQNITRKYTTEPALEQNITRKYTTEPALGERDSRKRQLDVENQKLNMFLNSTLENFNLIEEEKKQLNLHLNESLKIITLQGAESKQLHQLLLNEQLNSMQLKAANEHQLSILFSTKMGFIWRFCNRDTLRVHTARLAGLSTLHAASSCPTNQRSGKMLA
ncbi:hypothetical protein D5F01_LYC13454 [Larimichthys crocea]|uniref:Uncharacterized protein n=1 Tax=Larimichthys crocea TaxID=215358 RepID=A0A6G0I7X3_LARCR|nr:hypothetical protein D5F01_LYC13454 [Larimichthys crocea]